MENYLEVWSLWAAGEDLRSFKLWGLEILWWGRLGKLLQFLTAITLVVEITGTERIRNSAHIMREYAHSIYSITDIFNKFHHRIVTIVNHIGNYIDRYGALLTIIFLSSAYIQKNYDNHWIDIILLPLIVIPFVILLFIQFIFIFSRLLIILLSTVIIAFSWFVDAISRRIYLNIIVILLLLIGFHFDYLAS